MKLKGWIRLWIVLTVIGVPVGAELDFQQKARFWDNLDKFASKVCVDQETELPNHPDAYECLTKSGGGQTVFQREKTTPLKYWLSTMSAFFVLDLGITALVILTAFALRWVIRGFQTV